MTEEPGTPWSDGAPAFEPVATFLREAVEAQQRAMGLAQTWSIKMMTAHQEQAEEYTALLRAVNRSLAAMEELVESQTKANRALGESLDASRQLVDIATTSNQKSLDRLESLVTATTEQVEAYFAALRRDATDQGATTAGQAEAGSSAYLDLTRAWMDSFNRFLSGGSDSTSPESPSGDHR
jgi:paraquat-inducible protein B